LGLVVWSLVNHRERTATIPWRLIAAIGEVSYFWTPWPKAGGVIFAVGAVMTVYLVFQGVSWQGEVSRDRKDAIELIELIAWLWMLDALR
jgi:hypothetical protein